MHIYAAPQFIVAAPIPSSYANRFRNLVQVMTLSRNRSLSRNNPYGKSCVNYLFIVSEDDG